VSIATRFSRRATIAGVGGLHAAWVWQFRGRVQWGAAAPGATGAEAEAHALEELTATMGKRVRHVEVRWCEPVTVRSSQDLSKNKALIEVLRAASEYRTWREAGVRIACDASYDPLRERGVWGFAQAGRPGVLLEAGDATSSTLCELRAAHAALISTEPGSAVELLIDYRPLAETISAIGRNEPRRPWPGLRKDDSARAVFNEIEQLVKERRVSAVWVPGHRGHSLFQRVDRATRALMRSERRAATA
jgi:ribonuclease HI